jgi:endonuclease/exonuclease/phosphatase family metal-dependent hydrolase
MNIKLISWNLNWWQNAKLFKKNNPQPFDNWKYQVNETIKGFNANIILLQEINPWFINIPENNIFYHKLTDQSWGSAIISQKYDVIHHCLNSTYVGSSALMYYDFKINSKITITIINIYGKWIHHGNISYSNPTIHHMLSDIAPYVHRNNKNPIIIAGDFNATIQDEFSDTARYMDDKLFFNRIHDFGFINCMDNLEQTHINKKDPKKPWHLDYFFINNGFKNNKNSTKIYNTEEYIKLSDHFPIELVIKI